MIRWLRDSKIIRCLDLNFWFFDFWVFPCQLCRLMFELFFLRPSLFVLCFLVLKFRCPSICGLVGYQELIICMKIDSNAQNMLVQYPMCGFDARRGLIDPSGFRALLLGHLPGT